MMRMIVGFDPSKAQGAIAELQQELAPGVKWRVLNSDQNPNGVEPARAQIDEEHHGVAANLFHRLAAWLSNANNQAHNPSGGELAESDSLALSEEELAYLRQ